MEQLLYEKIKDLFIKTKIPQTILSQLNFEQALQELQKNIESKLNGTEFKKEIFSKLYTFFNTYLLNFDNYVLKLKSDPVLVWKTRDFIYIPDDILIFRNAKETLRRQFEFWFKDIVINSDLSEEKIKQLRVLRDIAYEVIDFIARIEEEIIKILNKPKLVLNSNYIISLDRIASKPNGINLIKKILNAPGMQKQIEDWKKLGLVDNSFKISNVITHSLFGEEINPKYLHLPIDTKYFKELELEILSLFDNLDDELDGWLIHSENYQALVTIKNKFSEKIQMIYIDPPYRSNSELEESALLSMLYDRFILAKKLLRDNGTIFVHIGEMHSYDIKFNETSDIQLLLDEIFSRENRISVFARKTVIASRHDTKYIANSVDTIFYYAKNKSHALVNKKGVDSSRYKYEDEYVQTRGRFDLKKLDVCGLTYAESLDYPIIVKKGTPVLIKEGKRIVKKPAPEDIIVYPGGDPNDKRCFFYWSKEKVEWGIKNDFIVFFKSKNGWTAYFKQYEFVDSDGKPTMKLVPYNNLILDYTNEMGSHEIRELFGERVFEYPKPVDLIVYLLKIGSTKESIILDFFGGSGTTAHAVMKLNKEDEGYRKFILIERDDNVFYNVIIPRIKKVAYSFNWEKGKPKDHNGSGIFVKYYDLSQFEKEVKGEIDLAETISLIKGKKIMRIEKDRVILQNIFNTAEEVKFEEFKTI